MGVRRNRRLVVVPTQPRCSGNVLPVRRSGPQTLWQVPGREEDVLRQGIQA